MSRPRSRTCPSSGSRDSGPLVCPWTRPALTKSHSNHPLRSSSTACPNQFAQLFVVAAAAVVAPCRYVSGPRASPEPPTDSDLYLILRHNLQEFGPEYKFHFSISL